MTPRMSIIGAAIRKIFASGIGGAGDYYWDKVVLAMSMNNTADLNWSKTSAAMHMNEQDQYWSSTVLALHMDDDPYWSSVVLAMHMDGADTGTVFTDVKGKTCTAKGNAQTKTATKKFGTASGYFDGTGDAILVSNSSDFVFGTGDFTVEFWVYPTNNTVGVAQDCLYYGNDGNDTDCWFVRYYGGGGSNPGSMSVAFYEGVTYESYPSPGAFVYPNRWNHIAVVRKGGQRYQIINGKKAVPATSTKNHGTPVGTTPALAIGREYHDTYGAAYFTGYIDDIRITKGVGRYDSSFYPPQRAFTDGWIVDEKGKSVTLVGNAALSTTQKKFGASSLYLDGNGDYATVPYSTDIDLIGSDFTIEAWLYPETLKAGGTRVISLGGGVVGWTATTGIHILIQLAATGSVNFALSNNTSSPNAINSTGVLTTNTWSHIAISYIDSTKTYYASVNGIVNSGVFASVLRPSANPTLAIGTIPGEAGSSTFAYQGYMDDIRITKGVARYTANFTPRPAAFLDPITAPTFMDEKGNQFLPFGTPTLTATNAKFGVMSASFNGTTDYLKAVADASFAFAAGDFTVEAWVRTAASGTIIDLRSYSSELGLFAINSGKASIWNRGSHLLGVTDLTTSTWFHLAWVRKTGVVSLYVNGKVEAISPTDGDFGPDVRPCTIGADYAGANFFSGLIDDVRITKGVARYTGEFTPRNYAFRDPVNNPMFVEETGKSVTAYGNVVTTTPLKFGDAAASFDGTGDYLTIPHSTDFDFGSGDFTIESWIYLDTTPTENKVFVNMRGLSGTTDQSYVFYYGYPSTCLVLSYSSDGTTTINCIGSQTVSIGAWHHIVAQRSGSKIRLFLDGVEDTSVSNSSISVGLFTSSSPLTIGGNLDGTRSVDGSIDDLRITKGLARYLSNFTPDTKQLPNYQKTYDTDPYFNNVVLGMHMDGVDTGTSFPELTGKTVSVFGNAQTKTATKKFGTASAYFDGTGDYLTIPSSADLQTITGVDMTYELWFNASSIHLATLMIIDGWSATYGQVRVGITAGGLINLLIISPSGASGWAVNVNSTASYQANTWHHLAIVKLGTTYTLYLNGISTASATGPANPQIGTNPSTVGTDSVNFFTGYIDDLRITKGVARYTANFRPIQAPFPDFVSPLDVNVSDPYWESTVLAMHMDGTNGGTTFTDAKGKTCTPTSVTTSTAQFKLGTASAYFAGAGYINLAQSADFNFGSGDFTIEAWVRPTDVSNNKTIFQIFASGNYSFDLLVQSAGMHFRWSTNGSTQPGSINGPVILKAGLWYHVAAVRSGNFVNLFTNGVGVTPVAISGSLYAPSIGPTIGRNQDAAWYMNGYIDDLRVTKGVARYTANFNPPGAFPEKYTESDGYWSSTNLAMHFDGADNGTVFTDQKGLTVTRYGSIYTKTAQKKFGTASVQFTGSQGDCFRVPASANWDYAGTSFTIEFWLYPTAYNTNGSRLINSVGTATGNWSLGGINWFVGISASQVFIQWHDGTTVRSGSGNISLNQWSHVAICGDGSQVRFFVNGILTTISTVGQYLASREAAPNMCIGSDSPVADPTYGTTGYMDDLQLIKGQCRYKANFAVPTRAFNNG